MFIRLTKSNHSAQLILLAFLTLVFWGRDFFVALPAEMHEPQAFLFDAWFGWTKSNLVLAKILAFLCVFLQAFWLTEVLKTHALSKNPIFVALLYIVLMSAQKEGHFLQPFLISNFFIIGGFSNLFKVYDRKESYESVFNAAFWFAMASLFTVSLLPFGMILIWIFLYYPINKWREWLIAVLGFLFPFFVLFLWASLSDKMYVFSEYSLPAINFQGFEQIRETSLWMRIFGLSVLFISVWSVLFMRLRAKDNEISQRKKIGAMILGVSFLGINSLLLFLGAENFIPMFIFLAFFLAEWFYRSESQWISEVVFFVLLVVSLGVLYS